VTAHVARSNAAGLIAPFHQLIAVLLLGGLVAEHSALNHRDHALAPIESDVAPAV
jgi:hypothetical protein